MKKIKNIFLLSVFLNLLFVNTVFSEVKANNPASSKVIEKIFKSNGINKSFSSVNIISLKTGESIYKFNSDLPLIPASNMKLITSAASLALLKPEYKFKTIVYGSNNFNMGKLQGNLYLKGFGDPDLTTERLWRMVKKLKNTGIKEISGDIIADESYFDSKEISSGWKTKQYGDSAYSARISALSVNRNTVEVWLRGGEKNGEKGIITLEPENDFFQIENNVVTGGIFPRIVISRMLTSDGKNKIIIKGNIPIRFHSEVNKINLDNPGLYTGYVLARILKKEGIQIQGQVKKGITPLNALELVRSNSRTLSAIVYDFNKHSVNIIGEILLKNLGAVYRGVPGTTENGADVVKRNFLDKISGADTSGFRMVDGSGLSPLNRVSAGIFVNVMKYMYNNFSLQSDYMASLPVSGADGTLRKRTKKTSGERKFRAKTGYINNVSCLSGYTVSINGEPIAFSILMNNFKNMYLAISIQDNICTYLATSRQN